MGSVSRRQQSISTQCIQIFSSNNPKCQSDAGMKVLRNSCPSTTSPTFSSPLTPNHISPSMNSFPHWTDTGTCPHLSPMPHSHKWDSVSYIDMSPYFSSFVLDPFHSSSGLTDRRSLFHISYVFLFSLCSRSTSTMQHQPSIPFLLSALYHSPFLFLIGSAKW